MTGRRIPESRHPNIIEDDTGVWTKNERDLEMARSLAAQAERAAQAEVETRGKITAIQGDASLSAQEKLRALNLLTTSSYSTEEFRILNKAREQAEAEYRGG